MSVVDEPRDMADLDREGPHVFPECPAYSNSHAYDEISMFSGYQYPDTASMDSWRPSTLGIINSNTKPMDFLGRPTPSNLPWSEINDFYEFCADVGEEPYFRLGKQWLSYSVPQRVYLDKNRNPQGRRHPCLYPGQSCWKNATSGPAFSRSADLNRHYIAVHRGLPADLFPCDYSKCGRHNDGFTRKDHCRDHYKDYHKEDIGVFKGSKAALKDQALWQEKQNQWAAERNISPNWWRCSKCLLRIDIEKNGWSCTSCKVDCELWRKDAREKTRQPASVQFSQLAGNDALQAPSQENIQTSSGKCNEETLTLDYIPRVEEYVQTASNPEPDSKPLWRTINFSDLLNTTTGKESSDVSMFPKNVSTTTVATEKIEGSRTHHGLEGTSVSKDTSNHPPPLPMIQGLDYVKERNPPKYKEEEILTFPEKVEPGTQFSVGIGSRVEDCKVDGPKTTTKRKRESAKQEPLRYDCPVTKRAIDSENNQSSQSRGCAPMGLEFRHVWQHIKNAHHGCETCGKSLKEKNSDRKHLREREKDPTTCKANEQAEIPFEVGIDLFDSMEIIYEEKLPHKEKWIKWWQVTHPSELQVPDPFHHGKLTVFMEDIPKLQDLFKNMWLEEPSLPRVDDKQTQTMLGLVEKLFRLYPTLHQHRHRRQKTKAPEPNSADVISQGGLQTSVLPMSSQGFAQVCDWTAMDFSQEVSDANEYFQTSDDWNVDDTIKRE